jgi:hypothetical protein
MAAAIPIPDPATIQPSDAPAIPLNPPFPVGFGVGVAVEPVTPDRESLIVFVLVADNVADPPEAVGCASTQHCAYATVRFKLLPLPGFINRLSYHRYGHSFTKLTTASPFPAFHHDAAELAYDEYAGSSDVGTAVEKAQSLLRGGTGQGWKGPVVMALVHVSYS